MRKHLSRLHPKNLSVKTKKRTVDTTMVLAFATAVMGFLEHTMDFIERMWDRIFPRTTEVEAMPVLEEAAPVASLEDLESYDEQSALDASLDAEMGGYGGGAGELTITDDAVTFSVAVDSTPSVPLIPPSFIVSGVAVVIFACCLAVRFRLKEPAV